MAKILFWNSIATRKRSASDNFLENGLAILKSYLEQKSHNVEIIDWARGDFYPKLAPKLLLLLNRLLTIIVLKLSKVRKRKILKPIGAIFYLTQELTSYIQKRRMKSYLKKLAKEIVKNELKVFGVKVWYGEAFVWSNYLVKEIKKLDSSILTIAGGYHTTIYEQDFLKYSEFDLAVMGEGEKPLEIILKIVDEMGENWDKKEFLEIIREKAINKEILNLIYRENNNIKLTSRYIPEMDKKVYPKFDNFDGKMLVHVLLDSLGCPWGKCNFCVHPHLYPQFYPRPVEEIVNEIEYMLKQGVGLFRFAGSETPLAFGAKIADEILRRGLNIKFSIGGRAIIGIEKEDIYQKVIENYRKMIRAGLVAVFMGGESGNDIINEEIMNKGVNAKELILSAKAFRKAKKMEKKNAYLTLALIYPSPLAKGISLDNVFKDNLKLIKEMKPDSVIITPAGPFKQTDWYKYKEKYGFEFPKNVIKTAMEYEYVLYKPTQLWPELDIKLNGMSFKEMLAECQRLREKVEEMGIPTDLTDEYFLMIESAGYKGKEGMIKFKKDTLIDLISSDYRNIRRITRLVNEYSKGLALENDYSDIKK
jgi:radical SAM superfamily enzyme YgiQ (UPF0313 family)